MAGGRGKKRRRGRPRPSPSASPEKAPAIAPRVRRSEDSRPDPPWGTLPLAELLILAGIIFLIWGAVGTRPVAITLGLGLASLGGLELSIREHFSGYRSHTMLLAGVAAVATVAVTAYLAKLILAICLGLGAAMFLVAYVALRRAFQRASGGYSFRIGDFKG